MKIGGIDVATRPLVIAEIGANHEGDIEAAKVMIRGAARTGADAVKFQTYKATKMVAWDESERFAHFQRLSLPDSAFEELAAEATANGLLFLSTPFDVEAVEFLDALVPAFKIASGDLTFPPLLERVAEKKKANSPLHWNGLARRNSGSARDDSARGEDRARRTRRACRPASLCLELPDRA